MQHTRQHHSAGTQRTSWHKCRITHSSVISSHVRRTSVATCTAFAKWTIASVQLSFGWTVLL